MTHTRSLRNSLTENPRFESSRFHRNVGRYLRLSLYVGVIMLFLPTKMSAQNVQYNNKAVDLGMRSARKVNPSTRGMELQIPLGHYRGRGGVDIPVSLSYSSKLWGVEFQGYNLGAPPPHQPGPFTIVTADYAKHSVRGWTTTVDMPRLDFQPGNRIYDANGTPNVSGNCTAGCYVIDRMMVWMPDGSGHELRASDQPRLTTQAAPDELYSVDGSRLRYQKSTQILFMPDGSRYLMGIGRYIDRNGNTLIWDGGLRDTLDRQINSPLPYTHGSGPLSPTDQSYSLPGVGGTPLNYILKWRNLGDVLTTPQPLRYIADGGCPPGMGSAYSPYLFGSDYSSSTCFGNAGVLFNPVVLSQIVLPNGQTYTFSYDVFGAIDKVVLPTGGYEKFEQGYVAAISSPTNFKWVYAQSNRGVTRHTVSTSGLGNDELHWVYSGSGNSVSVTAPDGTRTERYMWTEGTSSWTYSVDNSRAGLSYDERFYSASGQMLRRRLTEWVMTPSNASGNPPGAQIANRNARVAREMEFLLDTATGPALAKSWTYNYDLTYQWNVGVEQTVVNEFAFVEVDLNTAQTIPVGSLSSIPNGTTVRTTETDYLTSDANYRSRNLLGIPTARRIKNGVGTVVAQTAWSYDETSFPLLTYPSVIGWTDPATAVRANATSVTSWRNFNGSTLSAFPAGTYLATHTQYDQCGNVRKLGEVGDTALSNPTVIEYSGTYHHAYPTTQTTSDPDGVGPLLALTSTAEYDLSTGLVTSTIDANLQWTTFGYNDPLNRLKQVVRAATDPVAKSQTTYTYDDVARTVTSTSDLTTYNDGVLKTMTLHDGFGRVEEARQYESALTFIAVQRQYDSMGRPFKTSNPYRQGETVVWTTQAYDGLGRVTSVTTPDSAVLSTSYSTNSYTATDQAGKTRKSVTDSQGRLVDVYEDPAGLNYQTTYNYDVLDNLIKVMQGTQQRLFMYDSLKRLIRSRNPEHVTNGTLNLSDPISGNSTWSMAYQYDANSNLTQKTDARNISITYVYDSLNRNTTVDYSDTATNPDVTRVYDTATNGKGRLRETYKGGNETTGANVEHSRIVSYDALGRPLDQRQKFKTNSVWSTEFQILRGYNRAGNVISQTYPSVRTVAYTYDDAGRLHSFSGNIGDGTNRTYSNNTTYSPFGGLTKEQFGTNTLLYHKSFYNIRGQLFDTRLSSVNDSWDWNRGRFSLYYSNNHLWGQSGTDNNGNVRFAETWIPPENAVLDQADSVSEDSYSYDALNRLSSVTEQRKSAAGGWVWQQQFRQAYSYDRYGNRTIDGAQTWGAGINNKQFTVDTATNRLGVPVGQSGVMTYDYTGNLTSDTYTGMGDRVYDAENRMTKAWGGNNQWQEYAYNAEGQRVRRTIDGVETWQVYGFDGELLAEYSATAAPSNPQKEYGYRNGQLLITASCAPRINVAATANGGTATASQTHSAPFLPSGAINGDRKFYLNNNAWAGSTATFPQWLQVDFNGSKSIDEIDVFSVQDQYATPSEPTPTMTFSLYGVTAFQAQYWNGAAWVTVPNGSVTGNTKVWKQITFSSITTNKIRIWITGSSDGYSRLTEVEAWGPSGSGGVSTTVQWLVTDHLGMPRMIVDQTGTLANVKRHDYLAFGEELVAPTGGRTAAMGYASSDGVRQQFTEKERDIETGLDYFIARYHSSTQGRFTSADSVAGSLSNPQSLNLYSYTLNNPVNFTDPTGHMATPTSNWPVNCHLSGGMGCDGARMMQGGQGRPTQTKPQVPPGFETRPDGTLQRTGGKAVIEEAVTVKAKQGFFRRVFGKVGRLLGFGGGPIIGAAAVITGEMIDPQPVGGGDADLGINSYPWLTPEIQSTFLNGQFRPHRLEEDTTFFRYFGATPMIGSGVGYFSAQQFSTSEEARQRLALSPAVTGSTAQQVVNVTVPGGTIVLIGQAAAQPPTDKYPGGGSQVVVGNPRDPGIRYGTPRRLP